MTAAEKKAYHYKWDRFQKRFERIYTTKFKAALKEQVAHQVKHGYITATPIYEVLVSLYKTVGPLWAHQTQVNIKRQQVKSLTTTTSGVFVKARQPMGFNERIVELMRDYFGINLLQDAEDITAYTREVIGKVLTEATTSGASINDIARALESNSELGTMRGRRIARTETVTSANGAAIINAKELGLPMRKIWLAVNDKRTRHSHRMVDNMVVGLDDPFNVNGTLMQQPGARKQSNGLAVPGKETINCRCTLGFEVIE